MRESLRQADIRLALAERRDNVFWRNQVGEATHYKGGRTCPTCHQQTLGARKWVVPYGLCVGSSDLIGLVQGVFVGLEVKAARGRESDKQKLYRQLVADNGGLVRVVRTVGQANQVIEEAKQWTSR